MAAVAPLKVAAQASKRAVIKIDLLIGDPGLRIGPPNQVRLGRVRNVSSVVAHKRWQALQLRKMLSGVRSCAAEAHEVLRVLWRVAIAIFRPQIYRVAAIAAAANYPAALHAQKRIAGFEAIAARDRILLRSGSIGLPLIRQEFPNVAGHIEQAVSICGIVAHRGSCAVSAAAIVGALFVDWLVAPGKESPQTSTRSVRPFRFRRKTLARPLTISHCCIPAYIYDWMILFSGRNARSLPVPQIIFIVKIVGSVAGSAT